MRMIRSYFRLTVFAIALLFGVQIPGFIQQYTLVSEARLAEAQQNLSGFQKTADQFFGGSLEKLIVYYQQNEDQIINADGRNIDAIYQRVELLKQEQLILKQSQYKVVWHLAFNANPEILEQAKTHYSYVVPLNVNAIAWGVTAAIIFAALFDVISLFFVGCCRKSYRLAFKRS
ncbi:DUF2937 family protein [Catenovulum sp. 2E275]|uniref:DUF2937 family protein n=1 Tax=Catenovulum sp. 2E275 TaxID=2980497 RepID=UPI0021CF33E9|nr:DUF2937 family protein [Catenovulum sp. 2E275]MCU4675850.1 DUF2937 family protein [Catenovulum sp. 2E275]